MPEAQANEREEDPHEERVEHADHAHRTLAEAVVRVAAARRHVESQCDREDGNVAVEHEDAGHKRVSAFNERRYLQPDAGGGRLVGTGSLRGKIPRG